MTPGLVRGCGTRVAGGIYAEVPLGDGGQPVEFFLVDSPKVADFMAMGVTPVGVKLIQDQKTGLVHVVDWIGSEHYRCVADYVEEVRRFGVSRRLPKTLDFALLTKASRLILIHARASYATSGPGRVANFYDALNAPPIDCPKEIRDHEKVESRDVTCARLWWEDVEGELAVETIGASARRVVRSLPSFRYEARCRPEGYTPAYRPAIFASFPIINLAVIKGADAEASEHYARRAQLPVLLEDE